MPTVHAAIGNSDDKLSQSDWSRYIDEFQRVMTIASRVIHGQWYSEPRSVFQNACMSIEVDVDKLDSLKVNLGRLRNKYDQDSIALNVSETEFV